MLSIPMIFVSFALANFLNLFVDLRGGASLEKMGWNRDKIDGQKVYLTIFISLLLRSEY